MTLPPSLRLKEKPQGMQTQQNNLPPSLKPKSKIPEQTPNFDSDEDLDREIDRNQAMLFSRMLERTLGTPGDVALLLPDKVREGGLLKHLPTSAELREKSEKWSQGYTSPKTEFEEKAGETLGDVASFMTGGPGKNIFTTATRMIGIPLAGQFAKEGIEKLGGSEGQKDVARLGTMLLLDLWGARRGVGQGGAYKFGINSLEKAEKAIPKGAMADASVFSKKLNSLKSNLQAGITGPHTNEGIRVIDQILGKISNGKIEASLFPRLRKDINKLIDDMQGFSLSGPSRSVRKATVAHLNDAKSALIQAGNRWGRRNSPEFFKSWREGNEALSVYHKSNQISSLIKKHTDIKSPFLKSLLGIHAYHNPVAAAAVGAAKFGIRKGVQATTALPYRFMKSKTLRNLYTSVIKEASKGNGKAVAALSAKLEHQMKKEGLEED